MATRIMKMLDEIKIKGTNYIRTPNKDSLIEKKCHWRCGLHKEFCVKLGGAKTKLSDTDIIIRNKACIDCKNNSYTYFYKQDK